MITYYLLTLSIWMLHVQAITFPSYIQPCKFDDPQISECIKKNAEAVRPYLAKGIKELNIPSLEPVSVPRVSLGIDQVIVNMTDIEVYYTSTYKIKKLDVDLKPDVADFDFNLYFPMLQLRSHFTLKGRIMLFVLDIDGPCVGNFTGVDAHIKLKGFRVNKNDKAYYDFTERSIKINIEDLKADLGEFIPNNQLLSTNIMSVLNDNSIEIYKDFSSVVEGAVLDYIHVIVKRVFDKFTIDELFT